MIEAMRDLPKVCRHLHLPVQSRLDARLPAMRRRHTREEYLELVARLREAMPDIALSTDMIVGFPGETDDGLRRDAVADARRSRYHSMFSFKYSPRPNTLALKRMPDDVPRGREDAADRGAAGAAAGRSRGSYSRVRSGRRRAVLVDATSRRRDWELSGRTSGNTVVNFPGDRRGSAGVPVGSRRRTRTAWGRARREPRPGLGAGNEARTPCRSK